MVSAPRRYRLTVDAYNRMIDTGVFPPGGGSVVYRRGQGAKLVTQTLPEIIVDLDALFAEVHA